MTLHFNIELPMDEYEVLALLAREKDKPIGQEIKKAIQEYVQKNRANVGK